MPFASINSTNPRTHPAQFGKKILRIDRLAKWGFFKLAILDFFFQKIFFLLNPMKNSQRFLDSKDGSKFWWLPWFQPFRSWANTYAQDCICIGNETEQFSQIFINIFNFTLICLLSIWNLSRIMSCFCTDANYLQIAKKSFLEEHNHYSKFKEKAGAWNKGCSFWK